MASPLIKFGEVISTASETVCPLEFQPGSSAVWKATMVSGYSMVPIPTTVGGAGPAGGSGQRLGEVRLQLNLANVLEARMVDTYYGVGGGAVLVVTWGDGVAFAAKDNLRWLVDLGSPGSTLRLAATFFGEV